MDEHNLSRHSIISIIESPYRFMTEKIKEEKFYSFNQKHLGKFLIQPGWKKWAEANWGEIKRRKEEKKLLRQQLKDAEAAKRDTSRVDSTNS